MKNRLIVLLLTATLAAGIAGAYPIDGYEDSGIRRLEAYRLMNLGEIQGNKPLDGALLPTRDVDLRLTDHKDLQIPPPDPEFTRRLEETGFEVETSALTSLPDGKGHPHVIWFARKP